MARASVGETPMAGMVVAGIRALGFTNHSASAAGWLGTLPAM